MEGMGLDTEEQAAREAARLENTRELREWAERRGRGATTELAEKTGLTFAAVARIIKGHVQPRPYTAALLARATGGEVSAARMLGVATSDTVDTVPESSSAGHAEITQ